MWKYVSRRVKDTIEFGIHVRKSFSVQQSLNFHPQPQKQQQNVERNPRRNPKQHHLDYSLVPRYQEKSDEKFKRKYNRLNHKNKCFLNALTWSTALITGFYTAQLLCLYRRKQRLRFDISQCYYSKYLVTTSQSIHKNVRYLLTPEGQQSLVPSLPRLGCPFKRSKRENKINSQYRTVDDEFNDFKHFVDPGYNQYEKYFQNYKSTSNLYNVNNTKETTAQNTQVDTFDKQFVEPQEKTLEQKNVSEEKSQSTEDNEYAAIDEAIRSLAFIVGELEFEMGVESFLAMDYEEAVNHFKLSTHHNHTGCIFNLALCYEQGIGVEKNLKTAKRLYELASKMGHAKAFYNLGVFHAQGLGGAHKNFHQAKKLFKTAAELGSVEASEALSLLLSQTSKPTITEELQKDEFTFLQKSVMPNVVTSMAKYIM